VLALAGLVEDSEDQADEQRRLETLAKDDYKSSHFVRAP
jgi:hypothetical protein